MALNTDDWFEGVAPITRPDRLLEHPDGPQRHEPSMRHRYRIEQRRARVADLRKQGLTQREIAHELGVSLGTINADLQVLAARWQREALENTHAAKLVDVERCDTMFNRLVPKMKTGDPRAIEAGLKVMRHRAQLLGYWESAEEPERHKTPHQLIQEVMDAIGEPVVALLASLPDEADVFEALVQHFGDRPEVRRLMERVSGGAP